MVFVFKTNVQSNSQIKSLKPILDRLLEGCKWNFDLEDCDNILRIESKYDLVNNVVNVLKNQNFECVELK